MAPDFIWKKKPISKVYFPSTSYVLSFKKLDVAIFECTVDSEWRWNDVANDYTEAGTDGPVSHQHAKRQCLQTLLRNLKSAKALSIKWYYLARSSTKFSQPKVLNFSYSIALHSKNLTKSKKTSDRFFSALTHLFETFFLFRITAENAWIWLFTWPVLKMICGTKLSVEEKSRKKQYTPKTKMHTVLNCHRRVNSISYTLFFVLSKFLWRVPRKLLFFF